MEELKNELKSIVPTLSKEDLDFRFPQIAELLMKNYAIESKGKLYLLNEIEFYYYGYSYDDLRIGSKKTHITYERTDLQDVGLFMIMELILHSTVIKKKTVLAVVF